MKALEIGEKARDAILSGRFDQVKRNFEYIYIFLNEKWTRNNLLCLGACEHTKW